MRAKMDDTFKQHVGVKEVRASQLLLLACPGARVYTYEHVQGSDIRLVEHTAISILPAYVNCAIEFATTQTNLRTNHKTLGKDLSCPRNWHMELWSKAVATLQYAFWDGIISVPIHCEGGTMVSF